MVEALSELEAAVLDMLLAGNDPVLELLRAQVELSEITERTMTGVGFFTRFAVPGTAARLSCVGRFQLGDVQASIDGIEHGAGFVLFVSDGCLDILEGYTYDEPWPLDSSHFHLSYVGGPARDLESFRRLVPPG